MLVLRERPGAGTRARAGAGDELGDDVGCMRWGWWGWRVD